MISELHNFLFIHRGKSGGNSLTKCLLPFCKHERIVANRGLQDGIRYFDVKNIKYKTRKHASYKELFEAIPKNIINGLYTFSIIRNPYERLISAYFSPNRLLVNNITGFSEENFIKVIKNQRTFRDFACLNDQEALDCNLDFIIRFENFEYDINSLCTQLNLPLFNIPHINKSKKEHYSSYISKELKKLIDDRFGEEIDFFQYKF